MGADADNNGYRDGVHLFASLKDKPEGTGIYFGKDPRTLFVNVQPRVPVTTRPG